MKELPILEPDELGWNVVYKDGKFYEKTTFIDDNGKTTIYMPLPFTKPKNHQYQKALVIH